MPNALRISNNTAANLWMETIRDGNVTNVANISTTDRTVVAQAGDTFKFASGNYPSVTYIGSLVPYDPAWEWMCISKAQGPGSVSTAGIVVEGSVVPASGGDPDWWWCTAAEAAQSFGAGFGAVMVSVVAAWVWRRYVRGISEVLHD